MVRESTRRSVKGSLDADDCRKNRAEQKTQLRKTKKDDFLQKRRQFTTEPETTEVTGTEPTFDDIPALAEVVLGFVRCGGAMAGEECINATRQVRKLLSMPIKPPIDQVVCAGLVGPLVALLAHPEQQLAFEAAWCLTNIASGTTLQCQAVVDANSVAPLIALLAHPAVDVKEQAVWALGNIAGDCPRYRDLVLQECGVDRLIVMINEVANAQLMSPLRNATWLLSNLMRGKPAPPLDRIKSAAPTLAALLTIDDDEVLTDTCWALSYLCEAEYMSIVIEANCIPGLMAAVQRKETVQTPALRALSTMLSGTDEATQAVIEAGILNVLPTAMSHSKARTRKEACWATSNVAAGTEEQVQALFDSALMPLIVDKLAKDEFDVKKEAMWTVANVFHGAKVPTVASAMRVQRLVDMGVIKPMCDLLEVNDTAVVKLVLDALANLLATGAELQKFGLGGKQGSPNPFLTMFDEAEGIDKLEALQSHNNATIYEKAVAILEEHFGEDEAEDENLVPQVANNAFSFAAALPQQPSFAF